MDGESGESVAEVGVTGAGRRESEVGRLVRGYRRVDSRDEVRHIERNDLSFETKVIQVDWTSETKPR